VAIANNVAVVLVVVDRCWGEKRMSVGGVLGVGVGVGAELNVTVSGAELLGSKVALPVYAAVIAYVPAGRAERESVAVPVLSRTAVPRVVEPFMNDTVPEGAPAVVARLARAAVRSTGWPGDGEVVEAVRVVVVEALLMTIVTGIEVVELKLSSPA
jgi:hypothetical protein